MNIKDKQFEAFLDNLPNSLQDSIEGAIDFLKPNIDVIDEDFLKMLNETNPEFYETMKKGMLELEKQPKQDIKIKFINREFKDFEFLNTQEADIMVWEGNYITDTDILINTSKIVIVDGNLTCNNLIVNDAYLFVNGNVNCTVLFGASGNDKMTQITQDINAKSIVENGHYTFVDGGIYAEEIIMIHNEIKSNKEVKANQIFESNVESKNKLTIEIVDNNGFFDEGKFISLITSNQDYKLLK